MKTFLVAVITITIGLGATFIVQDNAVTVVQAKDIKWIAAKGMPEGMMTSPVHGDPAKGPSLSMNKLPAGATVRPHIHSSDEVATVVSGAIWLGSGETMDETKATLIEAGGYVHIRAKAPHWAKAKTECVFLRYTNGPADITYLDEKKK